ncbi:MAG: glycosyltransferase [Deltaproteobacteria bacterium]|nr:glycosyltransferase [Deltaproteobacteria bacterium]
MSLPRLLLAAFDTVPGPSAGARRLVAWLRAVEGQFDTVALTVKGPDLGHVDRVHGARILRVPVGAGAASAQFEAFDRAVRRQVASDTYHLAHFLDPVSGRALCDTRPQHGAALVYEPAGLPSRDLPATSPEWAADRRGRLRLRRWEISCLAQVDAVLAPTPALASHALGLGVSAGRVHLLPEPVAVGGERPATDSALLRVLFTGTALHHDGFDTLLEALGRLRQPGNVSLCVVGAAPPAEAALREAAAARGLAERITFSAAWPGPLPGAPDVAVFPLAPVEYHTGPGRLLPGVAEALGQATPVLAADLPLLRGLVPDTAGLFHRPGDARSLAAVLAQLGKDAALRIRLGQGAREAALARHAPALAAERLVACYARLLAGA